MEKGSAGQNKIKVFHFHRKDAESAKKRYFSFAVERTAKEKNQSLRDSFGL